MLKGVPRIVSPELIKVLCEMGHGDEIVIADANFPAATCAKRLVRADGIGGCDMLKAILSLIPLDTYADRNFLLMETVQGDPTPQIWESYKSIAREMDDNARIGFLSRFDFYERAKGAYAVVATGETAIYANIILKKGVI